MQPIAAELTFETSDDTLNAASFCWGDIWDFWWYSEYSKLLLSWRMRLLMILWMQPTSVEVTHETSDDTQKEANFCWADIWDFWWYSECSQPWSSSHMRLVMILWMQPASVELTHEKSDDTLNAVNFCWAGIWYFWWYSKCGQLLLSWHMRLRMIL